MRRILIITVFVLLMLAMGLWHLAAGAPASGPVIASGLPRSLDPVVISRLDEIRLVGALFEPLVWLDPVRLELQPALATSWAVAPDQRTWTFHLRPGACWSDGTPLVAEDMRRGLLRHLRSGSPYSGLLASVIDGAVVGSDGEASAITCSDVHTVTIRARHAAPSLAMILSLPLFVPATAAQEAEGPGGLWADPEHLIGNGPLRCVDYRPRHHYDLAPEPHYQGPHPACGPLRVLVVEDAGCAQRLYLDGAVDALLTLQADAIRDLSAARIPGLLRGPSFTTEFLRVRMQARGRDDEPAITRALRHPRLRQALARAIGRRALADEVLCGLGLPATTFTPAAVAEYLPYHPPLGRLDLDEPQARRDLAAAVADLGAIPVFSILTQATPVERLRSIEYVADRWRRVLGLTVHLVIKPAIEVRAQEEAGEFDLSRGVWLGDYLDPTTFLDIWRSDSSLNRGGFNDPEFDALLDRAAETVGLERWRLLEQAETRLVDQVPFIPLAHTTCNMLVRPGLGGITPNPLERVYLNEVGWR